MTRARLQDLALAVALVTSAAGLSILAPRHIPLFASSEQWLTDLRVTRLSEPEPQHDRVVIVAITEDTLAGLPYRSPVDRAFVARLLRRLDDAEPAAIGVDILFDQPTEPEKDALLRETLQGLRAPAVLAWADEADGLTERQAEFLATFYGLQRLGWVTLLTDPYDGIPRWIYGGRPWRGHEIPSFAAAVAASAGASSVPPGQSVPLAYRQPPSPEQSAFRSYPAHLMPHLPDEWLRGKIVLVGADLPHTDVHRTPAATVRGNKEGSSPGVEIHAHAIAQLLDGREPARLDLTVELLTIGGVTLAALLIGALNIAPWLQIAIGGAFFIGLWIAGFALYAMAGILLPLVSSSLAFGLAAAGGNAYWRGRTRRESAFIQSAFSRFTSPSVVRELIRNPERLKLGGEKREISCLFTDVSGFTSWIERTQPEEALATLNGYLNEMCRIVFEHDGTINKIIGDALIVFFGAPVVQSDHPLRAVRCALALHAFARSYARDQRASGVNFGDTRIGVHTGVAVVGNFGGDRFFDYTAYGDMVNTTARLEGANKHLGTLVCVSEAAARRCSDIIFRPIGSVVVVGRSRPIPVFEPVDGREYSRGQLTRYIEAFTMMRNQDQRALNFFENLHECYPEDSLVRFHVRRLRSGERGTIIHMRYK